MSERVVITGANRGLGLALVRVWRDRGAEVIGGCRRPSEAADLTATGATVLALDTGDEASIRAFAHAIGDEPVDVLVNNAGVDARAFGAGANDRDVLQLSGETFLDVMRVNAIGPMLVTRALTPNLRAAGGARLVNVSSQVGSMEVARGLGRDVAYTASKAALNMVTVKLADALGPDDVIVISLHPGYLRTDMGGPRADLDPDEAARSILATVDGLTTEHNGSFLRWNGTVHPW